MELSMPKLLCLSVAVLFCISFQAAEAGSAAVKYGVYKLKGTNPDGMKKYDGRIVIQREGSNYRVTWFIGPKLGQTQTGIGILENGVLSIGYLDNSGGDFGVVSMKVGKNNSLKGKWASLFSRGGFGEEEFVFESAKIPPELEPAPPQKPKSEAI